MKEILEKNLFKLVKDIKKDKLIADINITPAVLQRMFEKLNNV